MNDNCDINQLLETFISDLKNTQDFSQSIEKLLVQELQDDLKYVDLESCKSLILDLTALYQNQQQLETTSDIESILENTLELFEHNFEDETIDIFRKYAQYDSIIFKDNVNIFLKLYTLLETLTWHKEAIVQLNKLDDLDSNSKGIAKTPMKINEAIQPRINAFKNAKQYNPIKANDVLHNLYSEFQNDPDQINAMLTFYSKDFFKNIDLVALESIQNQTPFLNSSEKISESDIFRSAQINCFILYKKVTSNQQLAQYTNQIINDFFEYEFDSNLSRKHIAKPIQHKTYLFNNLKILEFQSPKNIKQDPIFS